MNPVTCDGSRLEAFLNGTLTNYDEIQLTHHLDRCDHCAVELERRAANENHWREAEIFLANPGSVDANVREENSQTDSLPYSVRQVLDMMDPTDEPDAVGRISGYEVLGVVGYGAMGVVVKAIDRPLDRIVALKVMNPVLAACGTARQRFAREAKAAAGVLHPNVISIFGVSTDQKLPYLVMPYVRGASLQQRLDRQGPLSLQELLRIGNHIAAGLAAAHQKGLIHRDIKPSNIMLDAGVETALITDFGLARTLDDATMTRTGAITGTPQYMSPEQARGDGIDFSSDIFSLASVLYALATGQLPFEAKTSFGVLRKINDTTVLPIREINPEIPVWFCNIVRRMHAKSPAARPTAIEVRDLFEGCLAHVYQPDRVPLPASLAKPVRIGPAVFFKPFSIGVLTMMLVSLFAAIVTFAVPDDAPAPNDSVATEETVQISPASIVPADTQTVFKTLDLSFPDPDRTGLLSIDINRGFVEVTGHDQSTVLIEILSPSKDAKSEASPPELKPQFAPQFDLKLDDATNAIRLDTYNQNYALNIRVKVPLETNLALDTYYDGYLQVQNVTGTIDAHSQNCDIRLVDIAGTTSAFSYNGDFEIRFRELASDSVLDFETYNGSIDLTLPSTISATTAISSGQGTYYSAFDIRRVSKADLGTPGFGAKIDGQNEYQFGTIAGGGIPIRIESAKGKIEIRKSEF
jgi:serine/threonine-protein kinase